MARARKAFICTACGGVQPRWMGRCPDCGGWDTLEEQRLERTGADKHRGVAEAWLAPAADAGEDAGAALAAPVAQRLTEVDERERGQRRLPTRIGEFDRVLGGGIVPGSAILVGGDPGIRGSASRPCCFRPRARSRAAACARCTSPRRSRARR